MCFITQILSPPPLHQFPLLSPASSTSLSVLASAHPHLNVTKSLPSYPDPIPPQATIYLLSFTTKLLERVVPHSHSPSMPCHLASALPLHSDCPLQVNINTPVLKSNGYFSVFAFLYFSDSSDINDHSYLSWYTPPFNFHFTVFSWFFYSLVCSFPISSTGSFSSPPLYLIWLKVLPLDPYSLLIWLTKLLYFISKLQLQVECY